MANFIGRTRLMRYATGTSGNANMLDPPVEIARWSEHIPTLAGALLRLPADDRPSVAERGGYGLEYDIQAYWRVLDFGMDRDSPGMLYFEVGVWHARAGFLAGNPPVVTETFRVKVKPDARLRQELRRIVNRRILDISLKDQSGDLGDRRGRRVAIAQEYLDADSTLGGFGSDELDLT